MTRRGAGRALTTICATIFPPVVWSAAAIVAGLVGVSLSITTPALAQEPEPPSFRVIFLGGDGRVIELPGGSAELAARLSRTVSGRPLLEAPPGWTVFERQPLGRGFLGVDVIDLTPELRRHYGAPADRGVMVSSVAEDSPADRAGVLVGDIVLGFDRQPVAGADSFRSAVRGREGGERIAIELFRDDERHSLVVEMSERERALVRLAPTLVAPRQLELRVDRLDHSGDLLEIRVEELVDQLQRVLGSEASLAGAVRPGRGADRESLERRMREVERELEDLERRLQAANAKPNPQ